MALTPWADRSTGSGVVRALRFSDPATDWGSAIAHNLGGSVVYGNKGVIYDATDTILPTHDSTIKCGDTPSLRFTRPAGNTHSNGAGQWYMDFYSDIANSIGENGRFVVQVRQRMSSYLFSELAPQIQGLKFWDITCQDTSYFSGGFVTSSSVSKIVLNTPNNNPNPIFPTGYHYDPNGATSPMMEGGGQYQNVREAVTAACHYPAVGHPENISGCWAPVADEWFTLTLDVSLGRWVSSGIGAYGSAYDQWTAKLWGQHDGQSRVQLLDWGPTKSGYQPLPTQDFTNFGKLWLFPYSTYFTDPGTDDGLLAPTAHDISVWYDEPIISTEDIPEATAAGTDSSSAFKSRLRNGRGLRGCRL
jgi:hypothetical protein